MAEIFIPSEDSGQYDVLAHVTTAVDYDWQDVALLRHRDSGQLYYATDCGCSCNWFWDTSVTAEPIATWQEWADRAQKWAGSDEYDRNMVLTNIERLAQERPQPSPKEGA